LKGMKDRTTGIINLLLAALVGALVALLTVYVSRSGPRKLGRDPWRKLNLVLDAVSRNYVDSIDYKTLNADAVESVLSKLDPHSVYLPPQELSESENSLAGNFEGIGIQFNVPNDTAVVIEVIPGGPSEKIGLMAGDRLLTVDGTVIAGVHFPQDSIVRRIKGPAGTKVAIEVRRGSEDILFEITRGKIPLHSVDAAFMVGDSVGYIRLSKFSRTTVKEFAASAVELVAQGMQELILDLRGNSGGYMDQALNLSNLFLPQGAGIVYMEGAHRKRESYTANGKGFLQGIALKVLIDDGSASSSEIFAGAMQDNDRGVIIGRRSFGKGLVQEPLYFNDGSGIRLTVSRFYTPSGRCIQKPYAEDYMLDWYHRYEDGELLVADSIKVDTSQVYRTVNGRTVYGGGGIVPDVFVPMDTTKVTPYYVKVSSKATPMRFASAWFDSHKEELAAIEDYPALLDYLERSSLASSFLRFARDKDGIPLPGKAEWERTQPYLMPQVRALVGRYSHLGDNAYYHLFMDYDNVIEEALKPHYITIPEDNQLLYE